MVAATAAMAALVNGRLNEQYRIDRTGTRPAVLRTPTG